MTLTMRDVVWHHALELADDEGEFAWTDVAERVGTGWYRHVSDEAIRETLAAMAMLGHIEREPPDGTDGATADAGDGGALRATSWHPTYRRPR
jgi:hypothetical protein